MTPTRGKGIIALPTGTLTRYEQFWESLVGLRIMEYDAHCFSPGTNVCEGRNRVLRIMLAEPDIQWVLFLDDDHTFPRDTLERLLAVTEPNDIVSGEPIQKVPPYGTIAFDFVTKDNKFTMRRLTFSELPTTGLVEVDAVGFGCVLVRRRVVEALSDPWFEFGHWASNQMQEDVYFCYKAKQAGFRVFMDCGLVVGHITPVVIKRSKNGLGLELELGGNPRRSISFYDATLMEEHTLTQ